MSRWYEGPAPCPGCGRTGEQVARRAKDALCEDCKHLIQLGRQTAAEENATEYVSVFLHYFEFYSEAANKALHDFLSKIENPDAVTVGYSRIGRSAYSNGKRYKIRRKDFDAVNSLACAFAAEFDRLKEEREAITKEAVEEARKERNEIFNEGVAHGRDLLGQLNRGEISLQQFNAFANKY